MKYSTMIMLIGFTTFGFLTGCQKESEPSPLPLPTVMSIFDLGDTLRNHSNMTYEEMNIVIDSASQTGFKLISRHGYVPGMSDTYFIWIDFAIQEPFKYLDSTVKVGYSFSRAIVSTIQYGDTIRPSIATEGIFKWFPEHEFMGEGYLKYHIYTPQGGTQHNMKVGENYVGFKFGDAGNERMGWFNIVYQDTLCYLKEGYYRVTPNEEIIVGEK